MLGNLRTFRLDIRAELDSEVSAHDALFEALEQAPSLQVLDVRSLPDLAGVIFEPGWHQIVPQVKKVRLPLVCFSHALVCTANIDHIHFELLFDSKAALQSIQEDAESKSEDSIRSSLPSEMRHALRKAELIQRRLKNVQRCRETIERLKSLFKSQRERGRIEGRVVTVIDYKWLEYDESEPWFWDEEEDQACIDRLLGVYVGIQGFPEE